MPPASPAAAGAPLLVALATAREYRAALSPLGAPAPPSPGEAVRWRRRGREYLAVVTGVGPVAAALSLGLAIGRQAAGLAGVVNCGIAGSYDLATVPLGGIVAATAEIFPEYGLRGEFATDARALAFPQLRIAGEPVFDRLPLAPDAAAGAMGLSLPEPAARGACVTVAGVTATPHRAETLARDYAALGESMEGFAAALAAATAGLPFLELRAVSNRVGARPPIDWDLAGALAALGRIAERLFC